MHTYNKKFYQEYGLKVTEDIVREPISDAAQEAYDHTHYLIFSGTGTKADIPVLKDYIRQYPDVPAFKNHLSGLYNQLGMKVESKRLAIEIINIHPDYKFGRISLANICIEDGSLDMAKKMLGEPRNITAFYSGAEIFHYSDFMAYHSVTGMYEMEIGNRDAAEKNLEILIDYDPDHGATEILASHIIKRSFQSTQKRMKADKVIKIEVDSFPTYTPAQTDIPPKLNHEELEAFYLYSEKELPKEIMGDIMQLPRETLIADLEAILEDGIRRFDYFQEQIFDDFNESEQSFMVHAAYFLGALEAKESLNTLLNVFRQGEEFHEYWFADYFEGYFEEPLFLIAKNQPEALKNYTLEPNQYHAPRTMALETLVQIALHSPDRCEKIVKYIKEICDYHFARPDDKGIIDTDFLTDLAGVPTPLRDVSLLDYARQIDERNWLGYMVFGDLEEIRRETNLPPEAADLKPMPLDIYEFYNGKYIERRDQYKKFEDIEKRMNSKVTRYMTDIVIDRISRRVPQPNYSYREDYPPEHSRQEYQEPVVNIAPKIGRNDPCPCGSGKKYKKCCLKKAS